MRTLPGVVACALLGCSPAMQAGEAELALTLTPGTLDAIGRTARLRIVATNPDGSIGKGVVKLSAAPGELDETELTLDDFGTAETTLTCPASLAECVPGVSIELIARWERATAPLNVTVTRRTGIARQATQWSIANCPEEAKLVYLFTDKGELYSFHPPSKGLRRIGALACPAGTAQANSMAVAQDGTAYVNYSDGKLFKVNVRNATCQPTAFVPIAGQLRLGMGFVPNGPTSPTEMLYLVGQTSNALYRVDIQTMKSTAVGSFSGVVQGPAELTGTADGELFGYFLPSGTSGAMQMAQIDPSTAVTSRLRPFPDLIVNAMAFAYAFSAWANDFYLYTSSGAELSSVTKYTRSTDQSTRYMTPTETGIRIVGAGVSRCGQ